MSWPSWVKFRVVENKKLFMHAVILTLLVSYTIFAWNSSKREAAEAERAAEEAFMNSDIDPYAEVKLAEGGNVETSAMLKVGAPMLISIIYGGVLAVLYVLPMFVDKIGEEVMGSSAEVEDDPLDEARAAVAAGEYAEAIGVYRKAWLENRDERFPVLEIAKIQRTSLGSPVVAVSTLNEALDDHEWPEDDAAFMMFRIAEIYEEDLGDREGLAKILREVTEKLEGTRHAANAAHRLREMSETSGPRTK